MGGLQPGLGIPPLLGQLPGLLLELFGELKLLQVVAAQASLPSMAMAVPGMAWKSPWPSLMICPWFSPLTTCSS